MEAYKEWGSDLILSGHLHGGCVRLPGIGGVITPQAFLFPKYSGEMTVEREQTIIVSKGLGTHTFNVRLFNQMCIRDRNEVTQRIYVILSPEI